MVESAAVRVRRARDPPGAPAGGAADAVGRRRRPEPDGRGAGCPTLQEMERAHIERALRASGGHRGNAARILGISERNLYRKLEEYRLS